MEKQQQLIAHLESLLHGPKQTIFVSELMVKFDMTYIEVTTTIAIWLQQKHTTVLSA